MSLYAKPHAVTVARATAGAGLKGNLSYGEPVDRDVQITPAAADVVQRNWGQDVKATHLLLCDLEDVDDQLSGSPFSFGAEVIYGQREFTVSSRPLIYDEGLPTDHIEFALLQRQNRRTSP